MNLSGGLTLGIILSYILGIVFVILKLTKAITWSWIWVLSPLWISWIVIIIVFIVFINWIDK